MTSTEGRDGGEAWFVGATEKSCLPYIEESSRLDAV